MEPLHTDLECEIELYFDNNKDCGVLPSVVWDMMKVVVRGKAISIMAFYKKEKQKHREELLSSIKHLEQLHKKTCHPKIYKQLLAKRKKLEALEVNLIQQSVLYLKQRYWLRRPKQTFSLESKTT